ncbi:tubulin-like doman-containing protein [Photobacterium leiognathi]|uniref:tubulin-like doman-containing protein n=1 Tax=Photobacterium leiognathi TaxID=553611 RepID=UPI0029811336|nr:tubulin-like doman-containing protein [Photobacterium leiognathi]
MAQKNTLLIGVGGTGCEVVRELKKKLHVEWRTRGSEDKQIPDVFEFKENIGVEHISRIATLSIDSHADDLAGQGKRGEWVSLGEDITLMGREQVLLKSASVMNTAQNLDLYTGVSPWLRREDEKDFLTNITVGLEPDCGCNQLRRLGRLALASGDNVDNIMNGVANRLERLSDNGGEYVVDIHVAGSIATGTGGGTMLDIIAQLQSYLGKNNTWKSNIYVHAFTTAADVGDKNTGRFYINQYAALKEYNAFNRSLYKPWDIRNPPHVKRLSIKPVDAGANDTNHYDLKQTYKSLFLVTDTTDRGTRATLPEQIDSTAELLFQLSVRQLGDLPNSIRQALSNEDNPETTDEGFTGVRSMKNGAYGVHRVSIPETKIRQRLASSLGLQFTLQLLYNNWVQSFTDDPLAFNAQTFVGENAKYFEISKGDLWLDKAAGDTKYSEEANFPAYQQDWRLKLEDIERETKKSDSYKDMQQWVTVFNREAEAYWNEGFRVLGDQGGVERYFGYHSNNVEINKRVARIRKHIEAMLINGLEGNLDNYTTNNLPEMVDMMVERVESEAAEFAKRSSGYDKMAKASQKKLTAINDEIRKIGKIGYAVSGSAVRLFSQYQAESVVYYSNRTYERAARYGSDFCAVLLDALRLLRKEVGQFKHNMTTLRDNLSNELNIEKDKKSGIEDWVNWNEINESIQQYFVTNKALLEINSNSIWEKLKELRGDRKEFQAYNSLMTIDDNTHLVRGEFPSTIRKETLQYSDVFHASVVENHPDFKAFFGRNIVKELYDEFKGVTPALEQIIQGWIKKSSPMVAFDGGQPRPNVPVPGPRKRRLLLLPSCQSVPESFCEALQNCAKGMLSNSDGDIVVKVIPEERCPNEISAMTVAFYFPIRQASVTSALKTHYDRALLANDGKFFAYQCHSESSQFPDLMLPSRAEELELKLPSVLVAAAMGLVQLPDELDNPVYFGTREDKFSPIENRIDTGFKLTNAHKELVSRISEQYEVDINLDLAALYISYHEYFIRESGNKVEELLNKLQFQKQDIERAEANMSNYLKWIFLLAKRNEEDEMYGKFKAAIEEAINRVIPELKENL